MLKSKSKKQMVYKTLLTVVLTLISMTMVIPFVLTVFTSLKPMSEIQSASYTVLPQNWQFNNYVEAMQKGHWARYFSNSLIVTGSTVAFAVLFNTMAGYAFARLEFPCKTPLFFFLLIGIMVPAQVTLIPTFFMMKSIPLAGGNNLFGAGGTGLLDSRLGLIIPYIAGSFGVFLCRQFFINFPKSLDEATTTDMSMDMKKATDGEYRDIAHPINSETRDLIQNVILTKYETTALESEGESIIA